MSREGELWHIVEAKRDDGAPTMFRIRELDPRPHLDRIFVVEMPYPATEMSRLPSASAYRRLADFDEQWLRPACAALGWELVGSKTEDGSFFLYMYGNGEPNELIARLSPFDAGLGFYDDADPGWLEYGTLRELLDQAKAIPQLEEKLGALPDLMMPVRSEPAAKLAANAKAKPAANAKARPAPNAKAKPAPRAKAKPAPNAKAKPAAKAKKPAAKAKKPAANAKKSAANAKKPAANAKKPVASAKAKPAGARPAKAAKPRKR
jgi:hypothetical protein